MIRIECRIGAARLAVLGFDRRHEGELDAICRNVGRLLARGAAISPRQLAAYCGRHLAESLRMRGAAGRGLHELVGRAGPCCRELDGADGISFGVTVDSLPSRTFHMPLGRSDQRHGGLGQPEHAL